jgi:hypothetical protein
VIGSEGRGRQTRKEGSHGGGTHRDDGGDLLFDGGWPEDVEPFSAKSKEQKHRVPPGPAWR